MLLLGWAVIRRCSRLSILGISLQDMLAPFWLSFVVYFGADFFSIIQ